MFYLIMKVPCLKLENRFACVNLYKVSKYVEYYFVITVIRFGDPIMIVLYLSEKSVLFTV